MRKLFCAALLLGSAVYGSAAAIAPLVVVVPGGEVPPPPPAPKTYELVTGEPVTFTAPTSGSGSVSFQIVNSQNETVYTSDTFSLSSSSSLSFTWYPPADGVYRVKETVYAPSGAVATSFVVATLPTTRPDAVGAVTGGGWFDVATGRDTFGFVGQVLGNGAIRGSVEFQDHGMSVNMKSTLVDWVYAPNVQKGYIAGRCNLNGAGDYRFFLEVDDRGEPGTSDSLKIWVYDASGTLKWSYGSVLNGGNIQVRAK